MKKLLFILVFASLSMSNVQAAGDRGTSPSKRDINCDALALALTYQCQSPTHLNMFIKDLSQMYVSSNPDRYRHYPTHLENTLLKLIKQLENLTYRKKFMNELGANEANLQEQVLTFFQGNLLRKDISNFIQLRCFWNILKRLFPVCLDKKEDRVAPFIARQMREHLTDSQRDEFQRIWIQFKKTFYTEALNAEDNPETYKVDDNYEVASTEKATQTLNQTAPASPTHGNQSTQPLNPEKFFELIEDEQMRPTVQGLIKTDENEKRKDAEPPAELSPAACLTRLTPEELLTLIKNDDKLLLALQSLTAEEGTADDNCEVVSTERAAQTIEQIHPKPKEPLTTEESLESESDQSHEELSPAEYLTRLTPAELLELIKNDEKLVAALQKLMLTEESKETEDDQWDQRLPLQSDATTQTLELPAAPLPEKPDERASFAIGTYTLATTAAGFMIVMGVVGARKMRWMRGEKNKEKDQKEHIQELQDEPVTTMECLSSS